MKKLSREKDLWDNNFHVISTGCLLEKNFFVSKNETVLISLTLKLKRNSRKSQEKHPSKSKPYECSCMLQLTLVKTGLVVYLKPVLRSRFSGVEWEIFTLFITVFNRYLYLKQVLLQKTTQHFNKHQKKIKFQQPNSTHQSISLESFQSNQVQQSNPSRLLRNQKLISSQS